MGRINGADDGARHCSLGHGEVDGGLVILKVAGGKQLLQQYALVKCPGSFEYWLLALIIEITGEHHDVSLFDCQ